MHLITSQAVGSTDGEGTFSGDQMLMPLPELLMLCALMTQPAFKEAAGCCRVWSSWQRSGMAVTYAGPNQLCNITVKAATLLFC